MGVPLKELEAEARRLGQAINLFLEHRFKIIGAGVEVGYCLLLFDFHDLGHLTYLSNSDRGDMIEVLKQVIAYLQLEEKMQSMSDGKGKA